MRRRFRNVPENMDSTDLCGDEPTYLDFRCDQCGRTFYVPLDAYDGRWDHPPGVPLCPDCMEDDE
jgi:hypothetical protein